MQFTVIIPCHNAEKWISQTLASVAAQTHRPSEIIVVNDNSTDQSAHLVREAGMDIQLLESSYGNAAAARNLGIKQATSQWVALLDADDLWRPGHLANAAQLLEKTSDVAYIANHEHLQLDGQTSPLPACFWKGWPQSRTGVSQDQFIEILAKDFHFGHSTVIYQRKRLLEVGAFDVQQVRRHDIDLWLRMIDGHTWAWSKQMAMAYRFETPGSISRNHIQVAYYQLKAMVKNQPHYTTATMAQMIQAYARHAMVVAFEYPENEFASRMRDLAWPALPRSYKLGYTLAYKYPSFFRGLIRVKRAVRRRIVRIKKYAVAH